MGYQDGVAAAESRLDAWGRKPKAKCDPRYGWKQGKGGKCERVSPEDDPTKSYGTDVLLTEGDKDAIENLGGSYAIDNYGNDKMSRKNKVLYIKDAARLMSQQRDGADFNEEIAELNRFASAREKGDKSVKNIYGTSQFISSAESKWIDSMGGPERVTGLPRGKAVDYLKDVYMTTPTYSSNPQAELDKVNKHYFGD